MNEEDDFENKKEENKGIRRKLLGHLYYKSLKRQFRRGLKILMPALDRCS